MTSDLVIALGRFISGGVLIHVTGSGRCFVCACTWGRRVCGDYQTSPQPELSVCIHGEVESVLMKWPLPIIKDEGRIAHNGSDYSRMMSHFVPVVHFHGNGE